MRSATRALFTSAMLAVANAQGVIVKAVGDSGTSTGLQVNPNDPADSNFISLAEITANVVNECGRTAGGNIDIGENTENALADKAVTQVTKGSTVTMTINQVNETGAGPYSCDLDPTSNALGASGQTALTVQQGNAQGNGEMQLKIALPKDMACTGSSQGNVCTVRCKNVNNVGGCVAVQQTDVKPLPADNSPSNIKSAQTLAGVTAQVAQNKVDLAAAVQGNQNAGSVAEQGPQIAQAILDSDPQITQDGNKEIAKQVKAGAVDTTGDTGGKAAAGNANAGNGNANANTGKGNGKGGKGGGKAGANAGGATGAATGAATGGNGRGKGQGANAGGGANNAANGGAATGAATGGNGNGRGGGGGGGGGLASLFGGGKNNNKRMAPSERRAKRYVDVGADFVVGGN